MTGIGEREVLCQFGVAEHVWALLETDPAAFKRVRTSGKLAMNDDLN